MSSWFNNDSISGGETIASNGRRKKLFVEKSDLFRIEKTRGQLNMIPHPNNKGGWQHDKDNPVKLKKVSETPALRVHKLVVTVKGEAEQKTFFLVDRKDLSIALEIKNPAEGGGPAGDGSVSLRR